MLATTTVRARDLEKDYRTILQSFDNCYIISCFARHSWLTQADKDGVAVTFANQDRYKECQEFFPHIESAFSYHFDLPVKITWLYRQDPVIEAQLDEIQAEFGLTKDQAIAFAELRTFVELRIANFSDDPNYLYRVIGFAGTGKSYLICQFIRYLERKGVKLLTACPTNKAAKNLRSIAGAAGLDLETKTVSQLLGQQPELNTKTGKEEFVGNETDYFAEHAVIIVDELSMLSKDDFEEIAREARCNRTPVIFLGDSAQLPPVKEEEPMAAVHPMPESRLETVIRYEGEIARVAEQIRSDRAPSPFKTTEDETIVCLSADEWINAAILKFDSEEFAENPDHVRFLAWRNATVKKLNSVVRLHLWGEKAAPYVPGDRLIALKPLFTIDPRGGRGRNKWKIHVPNSEELIVSSEGTLCSLESDKINYLYWEVSVRSDFNGKEFVIRVVADESMLDYKKQLQHYIAKKQWSNYFDLTKGFDQIGYAYALTVHKAQGSTIENVFLDASDMYHSPDRKKLLYTALTRTQHQAFVLN